MNQLVPLTARQVADLLSLREFLSVCQFFDLRKRERTGKSHVAMQSWGFTQFNSQATIAPPTAPAKFDIYDVQRGEKLIVACSDDGKQMIGLDCSSCRYDRPVNKKAA